MRSTASPPVLKRPASHYVGAASFFMLLFGLLAALYVATMQVDYVWRWNRIPQYFAYKQTIETRAEADGEVAALAPHGERRLLTLRSEEGEQTLDVPAEGLRVAVGDSVYAGDILAVEAHWRVGLLMQGLWLTIQVSVIATVLGVVIGLFAGIARVSKNPLFRWSALTYVEFIRGSPLLVQIFIWYFVLGTLFNSILAKQGFQQIPPLWYGVAAMATFAGAYVAEIVRAGIQSIHRGQNEAARSLGMSYPQAMIHVILPQAIRRILPPLAGEFISLIKDSSLLGIIAIRELTKATREIVTVSLQAFEMWFICALLYLILTFSLSMCVKYLERKIVV
ncbi:MAG: amino acid ABC transporter permease [Desulfobacterales bacterium]|nr:amino acid ABC transporter permease [Desulfobacterales bacterium]MCU0585624.1 amino acid ABC transporter permease [Desulfobacterales bacterium]